jgi:DHA1 family inner membrane transport protein
MRILFLALGESFIAFGGAMALAAPAGAVSRLLLGHFIDAGHGGPYGSRLVRSSS